MVNVRLARSDGLCFSSSVSGVSEEIVRHLRVNLLLSRHLVVQIEAVAIKHDVHKSRPSDLVGHRLKVICDSLITLLKHGMSPVLVLYTVADKVDQHSLMRLSV